MMDTHHSFLGGRIPPFSCYPGTLIGISTLYKKCHPPGYAVFTERNRYIENAMCMMKKCTYQGCMRVIYYEMMMILVKKREYYESLEKFFNQHKFLRRNVPSPQSLEDPPFFAIPPLFTGNFVSPRKRPFFGFATSTPHPKKGGSNYGISHFCVSLTPLSVSNSCQSLTLLSESHTLVRLALLVESKTLVRV